MKVVIIEEEVNIASRLREDMMQSKECPESIDHFTDFFDFVRYLKMHSEPDLLLVDMLQLNNRAMRYLQEGHLSSPLLFTNSFKQTSLRKLEQQDALPLKMHHVQLGKALLNPGGQVEQTATAIRPYRPAKQYQSRFLVKTREKLLSIRTEDISIFFTEGRLSFIKTKENKKFILPHSIETLSQSLLDPQQFFRVNRSTIVAFDDIHEMYSYFGSRVKLVLSTPFEKEIIVSRDKVAEFKRWLGE
jgi:DNA-binding LytR/AlgR family response regulator